MVNPEIRYSSNDGTPNDEFGICQDNCDGLRRLFDLALSTNRPCAWNSIEPDTRIAIYPGIDWPFCTTDSPAISDSDHFLEYWIAREKSRLEEAVRPYGLWTVAIFIDSENFQECDGITGDGLVVSLSTERQEIERFRRELEVEYEEFSKRIGYKEPVRQDQNG